MVVGIAYFFVRIVGKYAGAWLGCRLVKKPKKVSDYLGLALIPQAGVACAKLSLYLSGSYSSKLEDIIPEEQLPKQAESNAVEQLIQRIQIIQTQLQKDLLTEEEQAFQEAADEYDNYHNYRRRMI